MDLLVKHGLVFDPVLGPKGRTMTIWIKNGRIHQFLEKHEDMEGMCDPEKMRVLDAKGKLVIPGLINSHLHSHDHYDRGRFDSLPLELWILFIRPWIGAKPLTPREIYLRTMIGAMEMVHTGTTFCIDDVNFAPFNTLENVSAVMQAYRDIGMRAFVTASFFDKPAYQTLPSVEELIPGSIQDEMDGSAGLKVDDWESFLRECLRTWKNPNELTQFILAPSAPQRCTDDLLLRTKGLAEEYQCMIMTHTLETRIQRVTGEVFYGKSMIHHLKDIGFLGPHVLLAHCVWITEEDLDTISETEASIVHCPVSNLKLGSGVAPLEKMLDKKITVSLGTDNTSCNDAQNMFEVMKLAALLPKIWHEQFERWPKAMDIFKMATQNGAKVTKREGEIGTLKIGARADLTLLDLDTVSFLPVGEIQRNLVYSENGRSVHTVIVGGEVIFEDKKITQVSEADLREEIIEAAEKLKRDHQSVYEKAQEIYPYFEKAYFRCHERFKALNYVRPV
ncbi:MAG TPA: amidohydrolase family protein [Thermodesulfobacteriota bacterium]|nr:amidohydrolase family protein [Thermodesulfobacteriota bacterium]